MNFINILEKYRSVSFSERDKGNRFEHLIMAYLKTEPKYKSIIEEVWLWTDFPFRKDFGSGKDVGIDLVARTYDGGYWAIQCKCYDQDTQITKAHVDTFLATSGKLFQGEDHQLIGFSHRLWIDTTNKEWSSEANYLLKGQAIPVSRINFYDLCNAPVDWDRLEKGIHGEDVVLKERALRPHQQKALDAFHEHFQHADRGRLIMACGTGKTFTSLRIAENETNGKGLVLFLVPSIALLGQTLDEWTRFAQSPINPICICSDPKASQKKKDTDDGGFSIEDLALPASTDVNKIVAQLQHARSNPKGGMTVVFSTYQSIEQIAAAQDLLNTATPDSCVFDLIICDEAHRTTGVALKNKSSGDYDESSFIRVHNNQFIKARKRIYMTATPRLYKDEIKKKVERASDAYLCSMDDPAIYGDEVYRIGFGEAVANDLLSDYKVLVLTVMESEVPSQFQEAIAESNGEITADDISKLIGCINALSKRLVHEADLIKGTDPAPMKTAVAFCQKISASKHIKNIFNIQKDTYYESLPQETRNSIVKVEADHIDGTMGATERQSKLNWLKSVPQKGNNCRILTNVRCLSEGVDVPSLDAVMFLSSRNSQVDVVQSVGRVMRKAEGKKYGYIIIPVIIPETMSPEDALEKSDSYAVVWTVLNALRAHDDRFNAEINKLDLNKRQSERIIIDIVGGGYDGESGNGTSLSDTIPKGVQQELGLKFETLQGLIFARLVKKVGTRGYWEVWAKDVALVAEKHIHRIKDLISNHAEYKTAFTEFLSGLHKNINPSVGEDEAIEMLAQHIITKPVFEALFENYSFVRNNPVSKAMQSMIDLLDEDIPAKEAEAMAQIYRSIADRCSNIDNSEGRQRVIVELYDKFFRSAFPKTVERLGIVYTPVQIVDFILQSVADVLEKEFGRNISDENVHILDPFTGTGTFIARLLQSNLISPKDLERKYLHELHANEIVLLAYYIASINIENVYHDISKEVQDYKAFDGICLTDTFQLGESDDSDKLFSEMFVQNSERVIAQKKTPIRVIIGNPPYSVGQKSANDNAQNQSYPYLERRIADTYAKYSTATNKNSLYDSYIKAFRWASDRLDPENGGIIAFVSNGAWIDDNSKSGFRKCIEEEFSVIYVFNLRGNQRTSGELSRREGGKIFGSGSRTPISITILVKKPRVEGKAKIYYHDIGDYLTREEKLEIIKKFGSILNPEMELSSITPNEAYDWVNMRNEVFKTFIPIEANQKYNCDSKSIFVIHSRGFETSRDAWVYNSSRKDLIRNVARAIEFYNNQVNKSLLATQQNIDIEDFISYDPEKISWSSSLISHLKKRQYLDFVKDEITVGMYRPFFKQHLYKKSDMIHRPGHFANFFPTPQSKNLVICTSGIGSNDFSVLITNCIPDLNILEAGTQCFPIYIYEKREKKQLSLFDNSNDEYILKDAISDFITQETKKLYHCDVTKEDIFYYVYGLLHSKEYRKTFSADLKKSLARLPLVSSLDDFMSFSNAGRMLAKLHLEYEQAEFSPQVSVSGVEHDNLNVTKMRFLQNKDRSTIIYNDYIRINNIPLEAYDYIINRKSAIEWIMERYQITENSTSHIKNNPNLWSDDPMYILNLLQRIIFVSIESLRIIRSLPEVSFD